jgi:hypothetical protein
VYFTAVLWIRIGFYADLDPAFYLNADPDPDPGSKTNADPCGSGSGFSFANQIQINLNPCGSRSVLQTRSGSGSITSKLIRIHADPDTDPQHCFTTWLACVKSIVHVRHI